MSIYHILYTKYPIPYTVYHLQYTISGSLGSYVAFGGPTYIAGLIGTPSKPHPPPPYAPIVLNGGLRVSVRGSYQPSNIVSTIPYYAIPSYLLYHTI